MSYIQIKSFKLAWNEKEKKGRISIITIKNQKIDINTNNPSELTAIATVLKEAPVFINQMGTISSGWEQP